MEPIKHNTGKLYGIGVGPGDPELMTLKASRLVRECPVIAVPAAGKDHNLAYAIALEAVPEIAAKEVLQVSMPMVRDQSLLAASHEAAAARIITELDRNRDVAFLTLGDPSIYSTYMYIHNRVAARGYNAEIIPGISSFSAAAARLNEGLTEAAEALHIIPASYEGIEEALALKGTKVLMKTGKSMGRIKKLLGAMEHPPAVGMVERCGMEGERVLHRIEDIDDCASYFSILVVKDRVLPPAPGKEKL